jgi:hypothetical protein
MRELYVTETGNTEAEFSAGLPDSKGSIRRPSFHYGDVLNAALKRDSITRSEPLAKRMKSPVEAALCLTSRLHLESVEG